MRLGLYHVVTAALSFAAPGSTAFTPPPSHTLRLKSVTRWSVPPPSRNGAWQRRPRPDEYFRPTTDQTTFTIREMNKNMNYWAKRRDFQRVMDLLSELNGLGLRPNIYTFNAVVNACVMCGRSESVTRALWQKMVDSGLRPNAITYNILLKMHFGSRSPLAKSRALQVLEEMEQEGVEPDTLTFNEIINICVENGDMAVAAKLLQAMAQRGLNPDIMTYTTLIKGYGRTGNLPSAFDCVREMREREVSLTVASCNVLADACIRCGQAARALKLFRDFAADGSQHLDLRSYNIMIKAYREMGQLDGTLVCLQTMKQNGVEPDLVSYNTVVDAYCKAHKPMEARALIAEMSAKNLAVDYQTLHPLLLEEVSSRALGMEAAIEMAHSLLAEHGHTPNNATVCTLMEAMIGSERPYEAIQTFTRYFNRADDTIGELLPASTTVYNNLIKAYRALAMSMDPEDDVRHVRVLAFHADKPPTFLEPRTPAEILSCVLRVTAHLKRLSGGHVGGEQGPNSITYNVLMDFAAELGDLRALTRIERERAEAGLRVDHYVIHSKMKCHAAIGNLTGVTEAKELLEALRVPPNERTFSVLVLSLLRCGQQHKAELLLRNALSRGLYIHDSLFMAFLQHYGARGDVVRVREVFTAYRERVRKWTTPVWNAYLGSLAAMGELDSAEAAFEDMHKAGLRPTATTYAHLVRASCVARNQENAVRWLAAMRSKRFTPPIRAYNWVIYTCIGGGDTHTLVDILRAMERDGVEPNRVTQRAREHILRLLATRMKSVSQTMLARLGSALDRTQLE